MLYKRKSIGLDFDEKFKHELRCFEKLHNKKVVFGSTIGSISRGLNVKTSDYDVRFLFVDSQLGISSEKTWHNENYIRHRIFDEQSKCNCIALWDLGAFLNFVHEPYIDKEPSYKLVHNVVWTLFSPFSFDPLGIKALMQDGIHSAELLDSEYTYNLIEANKYFGEFEETESFKSFIFCTYHYCAATKIENEKRLPGIHVYDLLTILPTKMREFILDKLSEYRKGCLKLKDDDQKVLKDILLFIHELHQGGMSELLLEYTPGVMKFDRYDILQSVFRSYETNDSLIDLL